MKKSDTQKIVLVLGCAVILLVLIFGFGKTKEPVLIHKEGHLYKIADKIYHRRCSTDGLDHFDVTEIDAHTFQYISQVYIKDKNAVWNLGQTERCSYPRRLELHPPVDLKTFAIFTPDSYVAKDKIGIIDNDYRLMSLSLGTTYAGFNYYKDGNQIIRQVGYQNWLPLVGVPVDARPISPSYLIDGKNVYDASKFYNKVERVLPIPGADPRTFKELDNGYTLDKKNVYFDLQIVRGADPVTFTKVPNQYDMDEHCGFSYWKDNSHVFLKGKILESADPKTFEVIQYKGRYCNGHQYAVDKDHIFYSDGMTNSSISIEREQPKTDPETLLIARADLNGDGLDDFLISYGVDNGHTGLLWRIYMNKGNTTYIRASNDVSLSFNPKAVGYAKFPGDTTNSLIAYWPGNANDGLLISYRIKDNQIIEKQIKIEPQGKDSDLYAKIIMMSSLSVEDLMRKKR